jgi:pregnancy upregulated non-ubiquitously expressed CaM kinase
MEYARVSQEGQTLTGTVGTPLVATAPEVYTHLSYNGQAVDVWALGVLVYMLLCGMYPFRGTERDLKRNVRNGTIVFDAVVPSENAQDLVHCLIQVHPDARLCVSDALLHPWFQQDTSDDLKRRDLGLTQAMMSDWIRPSSSSSSTTRRPS